MKVLILHQHFNSPAKGGAIRSYYLAKALIDRGIQVAVICGSNEKKYRKENLEGIEVHFLSVAYENAFGFAKRSLSFLIYMWKSIRLAKKMSDVNICYAISTPLTVGLAAVRLKSTMNLPYIFEVGDLWPDAPIQMGAIKNSFLKAALFSLEKSIYKNAESVVALSDPIRKSIENKISGVKVHVISNFADCDFYKLEPKIQGLIEKYKVSGKFVVSYVGAIGLANGLDYFIECANASRKANLPVHFILCGKGARLDSLKSSSEYLQLENLTVTGFVDRGTVKEILNVSDAAFICYKNLPILETGSPNKYFDALASGKLIVNNFGGWIKSEIEQSGCGASLDPHNPGDFVKKIGPFITDENRLRQSQHAARQLAEEKYHRKKLSSQFADIFTKHEPSALKKS